MTGESRELVIDKVDGTSSVSRTDVVAVEEPLEIQVSSPGPQGAAAKSISITMRTPGHDAELATGFLLTEGIISAVSLILSSSRVSKT